MNKIDEVRTRSTWIAVALLVGACAAPPPAVGVDETLTAAEAQVLAKEAFLWGMHPVAIYHLRYNFTQNEKSPRLVGVNRLSWDRSPMKATPRIATTPNATTLYGVGFLDLSKEPVVVTVGEIEDHYWSIQLHDNYARWWHMIGSQFNAPGPVRRLLIGPNWSGDLPDGFVGADIVRSPSDFAGVLARVALTDDTPEELAVVNGIQDGFTVMSLSAWIAEGRRDVRAEDVPMTLGEHPTYPGMETVREPGRLGGVDFLRWVGLVLNDPSFTKQTDGHKEVAALARFERLGLRAGSTFDPAGLTPEIVAAIEAGIEEARADVLALSDEGAGVERNGWDFTSDLDYRDTDWLQRARYGLIAVLAPVPSRSHVGTLCMKDSEGRPLSGEHRYTITFDLDDLPPVTEFWEMPLYDTEGYFYDNPLDRYSLNSYMLERGKLHTEDGKLVIYVQHDEPSNPQARQNWLPAPQDGFRFTARFYGPFTPLIDGSYDMPGVVRQEPGAEGDFEAQVEDYLRKFPYQETYRYAMLQTGGDPAKLNAWVDTPRGLLKAGEDKVVRSNNDTVYRMAWVYLGDGPVVLRSAAPSAERFTAFQLQDDRNANYRNIIRPVGAYTLYHGEKPATVTGEAVEVPSLLSAVITRIEVKDKQDPADLADALAVYDGLTIEGPVIGQLPAVDVLGGFDGRVVREADRRMQETKKTVPYRDMIAGPGQEPGKGISYLNFATGTKEGWGGPATSHSAYESMYNDASGATLDGSKGEYVLITEAPPVNAFWSITVYDSTTGRLHPNDDDRYHINNTTAIENEDGTYTFRFKVRCEEGDVNCLEVPAGPFDVAARYYLPEPEIMSGEWTMPRPVLENSAATTTDAKELLRHVVLVKFKEDLTEGQVQEVVDAYAALQGKVDSILGLEYGTNISTANDPARFTHGFVITFADKEGFDDCLPHPAHLEFAKLARARVDDMLMFDYFAKQGASDSE